MMSYTKVSLLAALLSCSACSTWAKPGSTRGARRNAEVPDHLQIKYNDLVRISLDQEALNFPSLVEKGEILFTPGRFGKNQKRGEILETSPSSNEDFPWRIVNNKDPDDTSPKKKPQDCVQYGDKISIAVEGTDRFLERETADDLDLPLSDKFKFVVNAPNIRTTWEVRSATSQANSQDAKFGECVSLLDTLFFKSEPTRAQNGIKFLAGAGNGKAVEMTTNGVDAGWRLFKEEVPTENPTASPTTSPTSSPTGSPTASPTSSPTSSPTTLPSSSPTASPTASPTSSPTASPTASPTNSPIAAAPPAPTPFRLRNSQNNNLCLDVSSGSLTPVQGQKVKINTCNSQRDAQVWLEESNGLIRSSANPDLCIAVVSGDNNTPLILEACDDANTKQKWIQRKSGRVGLKFANQRFNDFFGVTNGCNGVAAGRIVKLQSRNFGTCSLSFLPLSACRCATQQGWKYETVEE